MQRLLIILVVFIVIISAAYYSFRNFLPKSQGITLTINKCKLETDQPLILEEGDEITLLVTSDQNAEFHIHDYDLKKDLKSGQEEKIVFKATDPGRHLFELENECVLGELAVTDTGGNIPEKPIPKTDNIDNAELEDNHHNATETPKLNHH